MIDPHAAETPPIPFFAQIAMDLKEGLLHGPGVEEFWDRIGRERVASWPDPPLDGRD
jgi:hypothetical protein